MNGAKEKALILEHVPYIYYLVQFKKDVNETQVQAFIDSGSKINIIHLTFVNKLGRPIKSIDIGAQKIDGTMWHTYRIVVAIFIMTDKANQVKFFE